MNYTYMFTPEFVQFYKNNIIAFVEDFFGKEYVLEKDDKSALRLIQKKQVVILPHNEQLTKKVRNISALWYATLFPNAKVMYLTCDNSDWDGLCDLYERFFLKEVFVYSEYCSNYFRLKGSKYQLITKRNYYNIEEFQGFMGDSLMYIICHEQELSSPQNDLVMGDMVYPISKVVYA